MAEDQSRIIHDKNAQIAHSLAKNYENVYYVDLETKEFAVFGNNPIPDGVKFPSSGSDFFDNAIRNADLFIHPDDVKLMKKTYSRDVILKNLEKEGHYTVPFRTLIDGVIEHMRCFFIMCDDRKHIVCCLENIENEIRKSEKKERELQSARRMARMDELTGVRNRNALKEYAAELDGMIKSGKIEHGFAIVMCDINDLKLINDTRGHSFGDEAIQRTGRLISDVYGHSPVFRVGGDEFVAIIKGRDYEQRDELLSMIRKESQENKRLRSGPVIACGMALFDPTRDKDFDSVYNRADSRMYEDKISLKSERITDIYGNRGELDKPITDERKRLLDSMYGALLTVAGGGYVYLNDMKYDYSRWSLPLIDDFGIASEYMYHADRIWFGHIHPDDKAAYREAVEAVFRGDGEVRQLRYRARRQDGKYVWITTRCFILSDSDGKPDYFGGIMILN